MRYRYPETEKSLGANYRELLDKQIKFLEMKLEAAYWASGDWTKMDFDRWLEHLSHIDPKSRA